MVSGIAIGKATLFGTRLVSFPKYWIGDSEVKNEVKRFLAALQECREQLGQIKSKLCRIQGREQITILDSHILLLQDELMVRNTVKIIEDEHINAEWAFDRAMGEIKRSFSKISHDYFRERKYDISYVENAVQRNLMGKAINSFSGVFKGSLVIAFDLSPAETLHLIRYKVGGFATEMGGTNSHTAIVARSLQIPYVTGVEGLSRAVDERDMMIIDGTNGEVIINPHKRELLSFGKRRRKTIASVKQMRQEARLKAITRDGCPMKILANVELLDEFDGLRECGTDGVGLYRTEFLFLGRDVLPDQDEQEKVYRTLVKKLAPLEVTIRTIDLGADKLKPGHQYIGEANPAMGLRAVRFCMRERRIFSDQITALLKASREGPIKILLPMISSVDEFRKIRRVVCDLHGEMKAGNVPCGEKIQLGVMIETPSAAMEMDLLAEEADFFSVGTNDLIQYLLAVDRTNELVSYLYTPLHPSVLRVLRQITDTARRYGKEVTLCGEMAADPMYLLLVMALGFDRLSMNAASIPKIKKLIRMTSMSEARLLLEKVLSGTSYKDNQKIIYNSMHEKFPQYFQ